MLVKKQKLVFCICWLSLETKCQAFFFRFLEAGGGICDNGGSCCGLAANDPFLNLLHVSGMISTFIVSCITELQGQASQRPRAWFSARTCTCLGF